ncbi:MAG: hypothetical protein AAB198_03185 [Actinomycetota bacterium]
MTAFLNGMGGVGRLLLAVAALCVVGAVVVGSARGSLAIVALSLSIPGFTLWLFGKRMGRVSGMTSKLREAGIPGTATIVAVGDTGVTVNNDPVAAFTLDVAVDDGIPYRVHIRQLVSRVLMGAVLPGSRVGVVVDPVERELVTIDWSQAHEAPPSNPSGGGVPNLEGAKVGSAAELLSRGRRGTAVITAMQDMGDISDLNLAEPGSAGDDDRVFLVQLEVKLPGRQAYAATIGHRVPERFVGKVGPRTTVDVAVGRDDDQEVAIDWDAVGGS